MIGAGYLLAQTLLVPALVSGLSGRLGQHAFRDPIRDMLQATPWAQEACGLHLGPYAVAAVAPFGMLGLVAAAFFRITLARRHPRAVAPRRTV